MKTADVASNRRPTILLGALVAVAALLAMAVPAAALGAPALDVRSSHYPPSTVPASAHAKYTISVSNVGADPTSAPVTVDVTVDAGLSVVDVTDEARVLSMGAFPAWNCVIAGDAQSVSCSGPNPPLPAAIDPGKKACEGAFGGAVPSCDIFVMVKAPAGASPGSVNVTASACGGGATSCPTAADTVSDPIDIGPPAQFGLTSFDGWFLKQNGTPETFAGAHPFVSANEFFFRTVVAANGQEFSAEDFQNADVKLPPGLIGNPQAYPRCSSAQLGDGNTPKCPPESQVGTFTFWRNGKDGLGLGRPRSQDIPLYNMEAPFGSPGVFGLNIGGVTVYIFAELRTGEDYGITLASKNAPQTFPVAGVTVTFWGVPAASGHTPRRICSGQQPDSGCVVSSTAPQRPFVSLPTSCTGQPAEFFLQASSWQGGSTAASFLTNDNVGTPIPIAEGCNALGAGFQPTLEARPTTNVGDSPSGLDVDLRIPQSDAPNLPATAHLRAAAVNLPEGLVINPASANGLDGCSEGEFGYTGTGTDGTIHTTPNPARCPDASKVATVEIETPLLDHSIEGAAYVAEPFDNPFDSLIALYIAVDDPQAGIVVKLAGEVSLDQRTGQVSASFENNPQLPFESFRLRFFGGAGASLRTPAVCGDHATLSSMTPWSAPDSGPPAESLDTWQIGQNCSNSPQEQPHAPTFDAGSTSPLAGRHSPMVVKLRRQSASQAFSAVTVRPPLGLIAKLAGTPACSDAELLAAAGKSGAGEKASPSCPAASEIGKVTAGAGAGPAPYYASGKVYLAGPYKGAPLSLATIIPATAGPFDLGTVVTRIATHVNPKTAEITAVSDNLPEVLQGIPLDVRSVDVILDKPNFALNPTSCNEMAFAGQLTSTLGAIADLQSRFQLGECSQLGFKPKMTLRLKGGTKRGKHPQLTATIMPRPGDANIASVSVAFPRSEFLENAHIRTICTRPDFAADNCPAGAIYGTATIETPLLDYPLPGNVYLRSSDNLLPDLVTDLRGPAHQPIKLEAAGRTDSVNQGIRNTFDFIPDAPFTRAVVALQGGNKGLLVNSRNICAKVYRATVTYTAHNGLTYVDKPKMQAQCKKKRGKKKGKAKRARQRRG